MMNATATTADSGEQAEDPGGSNRADMAKILGHDITQIVKSNKGTLLPEVCSSSAVKHNRFAVVSPETDDPCVQFATHRIPSTMSLC